MAEPFLGEIKLLSFGFAPRGWAQCNGQLLPINQNQALFSLLGTQYGGNGTTNFALPNAQDRCMLGAGGSFTQGQSGGEAAHTLLDSEIPPHSHGVQGSTAPGLAQTNPANNFYSGIFAINSNNLYARTGADSSGMVLALAGGGQGHENRQPYLAVNFCIALVGIFPSRN